MPNADFGNNVDEAKRKLQEVLTLVRAAHEHIVELESRVEDFNDFEDSTNGVLDFMDDTDRLSEEVESQIGDWESLIDEAKEELETKWNELKEQGVHWKEEIVSIAEDVESTFDELMEKADAARNALETEWESFTENLTELGTQLEKMGSTVEEYFDSATQSITDFVEQHTPTAKDYDDVIETIKELVTQTLPDRIRETSEGFKAALDDEENNFTLFFEAKASGIVYLFETFADSTNSLKEELVDKVGSLWTELQSFSDGELDEAIQNSFHKVLEQGVHAFAISVLESVALTEAGVATSVTMSPFLPEIIAAKKLATLINEIL